MYVPGEDFCGGRKAHTLHRGVPAESLAPNAHHSHPHDTTSQAVATATATSSPHPLPLRPKRVMSSAICSSSVVIGSASRLLARKSGGSRAGLTAARPRSRRVAVATQASVWSEMSGASRAGRRINPPSRACGLSLPRLSAVIFPRTLIQSHLLAVN